MNQTLSRSTTTGNDLIRISVVVFKRGSVIATVLLEYSEGSTVTPSDVQHVLEDDTIPDKELSDGVDVILVEPKSVVVDRKFVCKEVYLHFETFFIKNQKSVFSETTRDRKFRKVIAFRHTKLTVSEKTLV